MGDPLSTILSSLPILLGVAGILFIATGLYQQGKILFLEWDLKFYDKPFKQFSAVCFGCALIAVSVHTHHIEINKACNANKAAQVSSVNGSGSPGSLSQNCVTKYKVKGVEYTDVLNIRQDAGIDKKKVGEIPYNGKGIIVTGTGFGKVRSGSIWVLIEYEGTKGWVNGSKHLVEQ
ncbi:MAG: SH3 domain-containing protein [Oscillatoria sp. SIO1A7]|nr:SH3 domain-containing protein [Oscillatoria sp. SIO1A7]